MCENELYHHGVKGMKWGRRRWQNSDGSLTAAGKKRYITGFEGKRNASRAAKEARKASIAESRKTDSGIGSLHRANQKAYYASKKAYSDSIRKDKAYNKQLRADKKNAKLSAYEKKYLEKGMSKEEAAEAAKKRIKTERAVKVGVAVVGTAVAAYGAHRVSESIKDKAFRKAYDRGVAASAKYMRDYNMKNVYSLSSDKASQTKAIIRSNSISTNLSRETYEYAKRASSSTSKAVKTLLGKNYEIPVAELLNSGIAVFNADRFR